MAKITLTLPTINGGGGSSDPLKLDKAGYTGDAEILDNRIVVLENLQNLDTNFTGQAFAVWTGVGYVYDVIYPDYYIQGVLYPGATEQKTLTTSDPTNPRFDVFAVNATGAIIKTGLAEENYLAPSIDPETEIQITVIFVAAASTTPIDNTLTQVYDENTEWTPISNYVDAVNFNATAIPYKGIKHADIGAYDASQKIKFTNVSTLSILDYTTLKFALNLKGSFGKQRKFSIQFFNGATPVSAIFYIGNGQNNFKYNLINAYQLIVVDFTSLVFSSVSFDNIVIDFGYANPFGFRLDDVVLIKGNSGISPTQKAITSIITDDGILNATTSDDIITLRGGNGAVVSVVGKVITVTPAAGTNYVSQTITDGVTITSPSENVVYDALGLKVDKDGAKVLSDNNYTTSEKNKLASIDATHYLPPLQTTVQLSALLQAGISDKARVYVEAELSDYFYDTTATSGDIAPDDQTGGVGFWRKVAVGGETAASIKSKYESNPDTNAFTDAEQTKVAAIDQAVSSTEKATWNGKQDALDYTAENTSNKSQNIENDKASTTKYSSVKAFYDWAVGLFQPKDTQVSVTSSQNVQNSWNNKTVLFGANITITVPASLDAEFSCNFIVKVGYTITWAITSPHVWVGTTPTTTASTTEPVTGNITKEGNNIYLFR